MRSYCICFTYIVTLILLQLGQSETHVHKHHTRYAQAHSPHSHFKKNHLKLRQEDPTGNETIVNEKTKDSVPIPSTGLNKEIGNGASEGTTPKASVGLNKEVGKCEFPSSAGLIAVTPRAKNAGWAMAPDEQCSPGSYCPYACPPGKVMAQWNPNAVAYTYPQSMDGGLYCDHDGQVKKPFPEKPYCVDGTGGVGAHNKIGKGVSFCQTVLPGGESMLIPTHVEDSTELAVPGTNYWCKTAAHYYINPPGVGVEEACVWGNESKPVGNWSPYVAGANTDESGQTFVKVGWNPIFTKSALSRTPPQFGVKITCESGGCNGTPCSIDPAVGGVGKVQSVNKATGAGGADFCVVTVPKGKKANIEVFSSSPAHITSEEKYSEPSKSEPSSSSSSAANIAIPAPTTSKDLEQKPKDLLDKNLLSISSSPEINSSSIAPTKKENPNPFSVIPDSEDDQEVQVNLKPNAFPSQDVTSEVTPEAIPEATPEATQEATKESGVNPPTSKPDHLFDEAPTNIPHTDNDSSYSTSNHPSSMPALFETETELTSMASAGTEHTAAIASNSISGTARASLASVNKIYSYSILIQTGLLISIYNLIY